MKGYTLSPRARADLEDLVDYIALDSPDAADRVLDAISAAIAALADQPGMGHIRADLTRRPVKFWTVIGRYMVVYRERGASIEIVRVLGPGRDVKAALGT